MGRVGTQRYIAVRNVSGRRRWSKLAEWLSADVSKRYVSAHDGGGHRATMAVAVLFGEQQGTEQVNRVLSSMHQAGSL
jgi:hypothetical protein